MVNRKRETEMSGAPKNVKLKRVADDTARDALVDLKYGTMVIVESSAEVGGVGMWRILSQNADWASAEKEQVFPSLGSSLPVQDYKVSSGKIELIANPNGSISVGGFEAPVTIQPFGAKLELAGNPVRISSNGNGGQYPAKVELSSSDIELQGPVRLTSQDTTSTFELTVDKDSVDLTTPGSENDLVKALNLLEARLASIESSISSLNTAVSSLDARVTALENA